MPTLTLRTPGQILPCSYMSVRNCFFFAGIIHLVGFYFLIQKLDMTKFLQVTSSPNITLEVEINQLPFPSVTRPSVKTAKPKPLKESPSPVIAQAKPVVEPIDNFKSQEQVKTPLAGPIASVPAKPKSSIHIPYPPIAEEMGIEGVVRIQFLVDSAGSISEVKLLQTSGSSILDDAAIKNISKFSYSPALDQKGSAMAFIVQRNVKFKLRDI